MTTNIQNSFGTYLRAFEWSHWATFTTPYPLSLPSARRLMERFGNARVSSEITAPQIVQTMFWAAEPFDCREGFHTHALVKIDELLPFKAVINAYQIATGNTDLSKDRWARCQLKKYDPKKHAAFYVSKYISKALADYDLIQKLR